MIKRTYFFSVQCPRNDCTGSYSFWHVVEEHKSILKPNEGEIFKRLYKQASDEFKEIGITNPVLDITAFNRV